MNKILLMIAALLIFQACSSSESIFELDARQSMSISGKGPGQDAAINPYYGSNSMALVENLGENDFSIRIQSKGEIIEQIPISPKEKKGVVLLKDYELYFDSEAVGRAKVKFKKYLE